METEKMIDIKPSYTMYDVITMPEYQAGELLFDEIAKSLPDLQFIKDLLEYSKIYVNWQNDRGLSALTLASYNGRTEIVKVLLERPEIDVNLQNRMGETALMIASRMGHTEIVKGILERPEIDMSVQDILVGFSSFDWAKINGHTEIIELLKNKN